MRNAIVGSFVGFLLAAALLAACGGGGGSDPRVDELVLQVEALQADLQTQTDQQTAHETDPSAHHVTSEETPWQGLTWCIALQGLFPSQNLQMPGDPGTEMSAEPYIGTLGLFASFFAPRGWALCNGQLLQIAQNQTLFSLLGNTYGGDGRATFGLPDLRGRVPMHVGDGPNGTIQLGDTGP